MSVWAYENWQAYGGKRSAVFHLPSCPSCNHGQGIHAGAGDEHGRWLEFEDLAAATDWADRCRVDLVRACKRCLPTTAASVVSTASDLPGTYRESDGAPVTFTYALSQWQNAARPVLVGIARQYHAVVTYGELADAVQDATGIRTRMLLSNWIGRVLGAVSADCHRHNEPMLSSLCVHADGGVGPGYAEVVIERYGGKAPDDDG